MTPKKIHGHPALIIGAGRGGSALLEMFLEDDLANVVAMADTNPDAPGLKLAKEHGIPTYTNTVEAMHACKDCPGCIVYNLSNDDSIAEKAGNIFGDKRVASGPDVKLFWQMVMNIKRIKKALEKNQDQLQSIIHNVMDGIIMINESGEIQGFNPAAEKIFGYSQQDVLHKNITMLMQEPDRSQHDTHISRYLHTGQGKILGVRGHEVAAIRKTGDQFTLEIAVSEILLEGQRYFIGIVRDIADRREAEQKLAYLAHHDSLTGLPNRLLFFNNLQHAIRLAKRNSHKVATLFLDLDGFKQVNDTLGHSAGDQLLQGVAKRLKETIRVSDTVARIGGDEFTFALYNIGTEENVALIARKIIAALSHPFDLKDAQCRVGGSIGISIHPDDSENIEELIVQADKAMYLAKQNGKNTYRFYRDMAFN